MPATGGQVNFTYLGLPLEAVKVVGDDASEGNIPNASWAWAPCCTDGNAVRGGLDGEFKVTITPEFISGIDTWIARSGPGGESIIEFDAANPVNIQARLAAPNIRKSPRLANLWLCNAGPCDNKLSGVGGVNLNVNLGSEIDTLDPKCVGFPNFSDPATCETQQIGSFEFEVRYDAKYVTVTVDAGGLILQPENCDSFTGEGFVQFFCVTKGKPIDASSGPGTLAVVRVRPTADVYKLLIPNQENGIVTQLINQDCQLSDLQGHPIKTDLCENAAITIRYLEGDVHSDCVIDALDQQQVAFRWGAQLGNLLYDARYDLEPSFPQADGDIDAKDLQFVYGRHTGDGISSSTSSCKDPHPPQPPADPQGCASDEFLVAGFPGVSLLDPATLSAALPIFNTGKVPAENVALTAITLSDGTISVPVSLPFNLDTIPAGGDADVYTQFLGAFEPLGSYVLTVEGEYLGRDTIYCFTLESKLLVPAGAPGSDTLDSIEVPSEFTIDAPFPPQPPTRPHVDGLNPPRGVVPLGPFEPGDPPPGQTSIVPAPIGDGGGNALDPDDGSAATSGDPGAAGSPPAIVFKVNNGLGLTSGISATAEPSGGVSSGGVVFATANWRAAFSPDGINFTPLNPTTIFPSDKIGFCCDQIVQYAPSIDRFIWLLQGSTGYRLAVASPADIISSSGTAWTYWNLTAQLFGQPVGTGLDYPDMSLGDDFLYMSWDAGAPCPTPPTGCTSGFQVARTSLAGLQAGGTITLGFTDPANGSPWGSHLMQDTGDEIFWAGHNNNSEMRIFSLQEDSNTYFWRDRGISSWANNRPTSTTPDGRDWLAKNFNWTGSGGSFPRNSVIGSTRAGNELWFAWTAGTDSNFPQAHIEMVTFNRDDDFSKIQQVQIWNANYAFAYPSLSTNACTFEVGLSFEFGGKGNYENHVVGFWGDFTAYTTTTSNVGTTRFGDYVTIRRAPPAGANLGNMFAAFGYGLNSTGTNVDVRYVQFGRPASSCPILF